MNIIKFNNSILKYDGKWLNADARPDYNPLNLPPNTVRVRTSDGEQPSKESYYSYETATLVPGTTDVYDVYKSGTSLGNMCYGCYNIVEVLGANTTGVRKMNDMFCKCDDLTSVALFDTSSVTNMSNMFSCCPNLTTVPLFNTSNVTAMAYMFAYSSVTTIPLFDTSNVSAMQNMFFTCGSLTTVPLLDTSSVTNMDNMFDGCTYVESGALALYQQASTQTNPPTNHTNTFRDCGSNTTTGAAELAQIPSGWK